MGLWPNPTRFFLCMEAWSSGAFPMFLSACCALDIDFDTAALAYRPCYRPCPTSVAYLKERAEMGNNPTAGTYWQLWDRPVLYCHLSCLGGLWIGQWGNTLKKVSTEAQKDAKIQRRCLFCQTHCMAKTIKLAEIACPLSPEINRNKAGMLEIQAPY